jgi:hypothetical protein
MTHYGPSLPSLRPDPATILGLSGDGKSVVLWLKGTDTFGLLESRIEKELTAHEAIDLARRLLIEATPLLKRGV